MSDFHKRPFRILADFPDVRRFMLRVYQRDWRGGVPAPFLEYALSASWADQTHAHHDAIWEQGGEIVAFCFYESRPGVAYFNVDPTVAAKLADELIDHAEAELTDAKGAVALQLFAGQDALIAAAKKRGYRLTETHVDALFDLRKPLEHPLPAGFRFVDPARIDLAKAMLCCWKGFDHEAEGPWDGDADPGLRTALTPNATPQYYVAVEHEETGEYVCWAGMWWTPENKLAYMEPLCTVPAFRHRGLAAAALSEMARRMRPLGATWMTGGANPFYTRIGYEPAIEWRKYAKA
ncbi:MAG: GNAT family N-acetyltransferase [Eubacteriales bacterium]|nr:GNAT family N-acetyltransferase [Eubacteriales bacterium]